jgi:aromatic amino acid aminotransferase I
MGDQPQTNGHAVVDFSRHLNTVAKSRRASPLKDVIRYMAVPGMISMGGGE